MNFYSLFRAPSILAILCVIVTTSFVTSCDTFLPSAPSDADVLSGTVNDLTPEQQANHAKGDTEFARVFAQADGLGPVFVAAACENCHIGDGKGHPLTFLTRFGRMENGTFNPMREQGGPQLQHRAIAGYIPETIPVGATGVTKLMAPSVTGLGFLEAVEDATILALADPDDANSDGISGVPSYIQPPDFFQPLPAHHPLNGSYIGRFGRKAGAIDLLQQTATAYHEDMGITSDFFMHDVFNPQQGVFTGDNVPDPEVGSSVVRNVVFYLRTLKAPQRRNADDPSVKTGEQAFAKIGCAGCHVPTVKTGKSEIAALNEATIHPYTDLLLHDMGAELDDKYTEGSAKTAEWRTTPLWGLGLSATAQGGRAFYLHDGRATTLLDAIKAHGGEAARSRERFNALSETEKQQLIKFLESL